MITLRKLLFLLLALSITFSSFAQIGNVSNTLSVGEDHQPTGICWDGSHLWMIDYSEDMICKIDPSTAEVLLSFPAPDTYSTGLAWDGTNLWCSGNRTNKIYQLDDSGQTIKTINVSGTPRGITFIQGSLWYADSQKKHIYKLNSDTGEYIDTIPAPGGTSRGLAYDGKYLWCADNSLKEIYKIDLDYQKIIMIIPSPNDSPYGICWDGSDLWIAGNSSKTLKKMHTTGTNPVVYLDSLNAHLQYKLTIRNVGSTFMNLRTWISQPYSSLKQNLDSDIVFSPYPLSFTNDQWDQRFAYYNNTINPGDSILFNMNMDATTYDMRYYIFPDEVGTIRDVSASIQSSYLADGDYYDIHNQIVKDAVTEAIGTETNMYWKARKIHDYIINEIHYVLDGRWDKAPQILTQGHGSCSEYSYLFIAMCRAAHIPARYEAGAYNGGQLPYIDEVFHRWSQIYLPPYGWIHVDATWDDREYPANQYRYFGATSKRLFATTLGGGGSNKISWTYNSANSQTGGIRERSRQYTWSQIGSSSIDPQPNTNVVLHQNYPNPFNDQTTISFNLAKHSKVIVNIINLQGIVVKKLLSEPLSPGEHLLLWNRTNIAPGAYLIQLLTEEEIHTTSCIISR
ncbi:MAG: T9SS type A sorting domain-containing protein [Bacteroidales bacterium]|nr:T9SS type A sorting domain-containing protein [Bacteroidales bacterium]